MAAEAATEIVSVEVAPCEPGVTLAGDSAQVGSGVAEPVTAQVSATALPKVLPVEGATMIVDVPWAPAATVTDADCAVMVKSATAGGVGGGATVLVKVHDSTFWLEVLPPVPPVKPIYAVLLPMV